MSQIVTPDFSPTTATEPLSKIIGRHMRDAAIPGAHYGLIVSAGTSGKASISAGVLHTKEGHRVQETGALPDAVSIVPPGAGVARWDRICCHHQYTATEPNVPASFLILKGTEGATPVPPAEGAYDHTLAFGYVADSATDYSFFIQARRDMLEAQSFTTLGDGVTTFGRYNGWPGLLEIIAACRASLYTPTVLVAGTITLMDTLRIPAGLKFAGTPWQAAFAAPADAAFTAIKADGFESSTGETQTGTAYLDDPDEDFTAYNTLWTVRITSGPDAGSYSIASVVSAHRLALTAGTLFTGGACHYELVCEKITLDGIIIGAAEGQDAIDLSYTRYARLRDCIGASAGSGSAAFITAARARNLSIVRATVSQDFDDGLALSFVETGLCIDSDFADADVTVASSCAAFLIDRIKSSGAISVLGATNGNFAWPFSVEHGPDGEQRAASITEVELAASVAGDGLTGGAGDPLEVAVDDSSIEIGPAPSPGEPKPIQVKADGIHKGHLHSDCQGDGLKQEAGGALAADVDGLYVITYAGAITLNTRQSARAHRTSSTQEVETEVSTIVDFNGVDWDEGPSGARITTGAAWKYTATRDMLVSVQAVVDLGGAVSFENLLPSQYSVMDLKVHRAAGGTNSYRLDKRYAFDNAGTYNFGMTLSGGTLVKLLAGDYLYVEAWHNAGESGYVQTSSSHINIIE